MSYMLPTLCRATCRIRVFAATSVPQLANVSSQHSVGRMCQLGTDATSSTSNGTSKQDVRHGLSPEEHKSQQKFAKRIESLELIEGLVALGSRQQLKPVQAGMILQKMANLMRVESNSESSQTASFLNDKNFIHITDVLHKNATILSTPLLLSSLNSLLTLCPGESFIIESLERQVLFQMKRMPVGQVFRVLDMYHSQPDSSLRKQVVEEAMRVVETRWVEITNPKDLVFLMYKAACSKNMELMNNLEDKALVLCEYASPKDLYRIFYIMGKLHRRNAPLLKAIAYHLNKHDLAYMSPVHLTNLAFSCASLNIVDHNLLEQMTKILVSKLAEFDGNLLTSIAKSYGMLRWRDPVLLECIAQKCAKELEENPTAAEFNDCSGALLQTSATLDSLPASLQTSLEKLLPALKERQQNEPKKWLDTVWALAILQRLNIETAESVLSKAFQDELKDKKLLSQPQIQLKLLNINAAAQIDLPHYNGPLIGENFVQEHNVKVPVRGSRAAMMDNLVEALGKLAPSEKYRTLNLSTPYAYIIDVELLVNAKGEPQPLSEYKPQCQWQKAGTKEVPNDFHRLAIKAVDFQDMSRCSPKLLGLHTMMLRHLNKLGYKTIQIPYTDFKQLDSLVKKVQYLQTLIEQSIK